ncbi:hypothetical protein [Paenibacillus flagellatus]|uniref:Uncharacterized protein n=1 Tax=Paenibacillus flagellatus TaxID=2211139 RepID=A0A2V5JZ13_9BACL|nr:hypothetical protein [Paenibacillus flagellatus]PYI52169.1 hypothetical protein DLM86_22090 [Paenibacillus flagellatus]
METKQCIFCGKIVPVQAKGETYRFVGCLCAPESSYKLRADSCDAYAALPVQTKQLLFPILSGYIRELTDCDEPVCLSIDDAETIRNSPRVPVTVEAKADKLLRFFYRRSGGPNETIVLRQLGDHFNLTYSPNLQELVHIIEKLRDERLIERTGSAFRLTESGWREAAAKAEGRRLKRCAVVVRHRDGMRGEWAETVFPRLEQCGFLPSYVEYTPTGKLGDDALQSIADSKLLIADLSGASPDAYLAAGYALGLDVPVVCTVQRGDADRLPVQSGHLRPIVWEQAAGLADMLQHRLTAP